MGAHRSCKPEARVRFSPPPPEFWSHGQAELTPACHAGSGSSTLPGTAKFDGSRSVQRFSTTACDAVRGSSNLLGYPKVCARGGTGIHTGLRNQLWEFESLRAHQIGVLAERLLHLPVEQTVLATFEGSSPSHSTNCPPVVELA